MQYVCLKCGHIWDTSPKIIWGYHRCTNANCRSTDTAPVGFWAIVEVARERGISYDTPILDVITACQTVQQEESILSLGFREFRRVIKRVIQEAEQRQRRKDKHLEKYVKKF